MPYHDGSAHGLAFSCLNKIPPSLGVIYKELEREFGKKARTGNLQNWADQGVLLLNTILTVDKGVTLSHKGQGWEQFTVEVIRAINCHYNKIVFCLWGKESLEYKQYIDPKHIILEAPHPAAQLYGGKEFVGCGHFSKINDLLVSFNKDKIDW